MGTQLLSQGPFLLGHTLHRSPFVSLQQGPAVCYSTDCESRQAQAIRCAPPPSLPSHRDAPSAPRGLPVHISGTSLGQQHSPCSAYVSKLAAMVLTLSPSFLYRKGSKMDQTFPRFSLFLHGSSLRPVLNIFNTTTGLRRVKW